MSIQRNDQLFTAGRFFCDNELFLEIQPPSINKNEVSGKHLEHFCDLY